MSLNINYKFCKELKEILFENLSLNCIKENWNVIKRIDIKFYEIYYEIGFKKLICNYIE